MHKTRTFSIRESGETWRGNAKGIGRKKEEGERRSPDEDVQGTASPERVSYSCWHMNNLAYSWRRVIRFLNSYNVFSCRDPIPVPEKVRKPLTEVKGFNLYLEHRAVERAEFDHKVKFVSLWLHITRWYIAQLLNKVNLQIKEKEMMYKRYREESEAARMVWILIFIRILPLLLWILP